MIKQGTLFNGEKVGWMRYIFPGNEICGRSELDMVLLYLGQKGLIAHLQ
jgi:hypothetical protein